ncbi:hypothetical protein [Leptospira kirschneri]|uniref:hypothetical protein n=1 Tax=Leptospira kirschneri TaxID=29507 RepID=UPI0002DA16E3|nr:hypothetical protein [Leptospira kirschneri]KON79244.1 Uncharacterized protein NV38_0000062 [Leptospira kirschneri serovar Mozdok]KPZ78449.1 hypothetical protein APS47_00160 [Leptospira kirschneri serovar Mozdok]NDK05153.1 hypothetical protein [Leptospira kirschneri serovar Mozdok]
MRQIHLLTETEFKQRFDRETLESLFENSHPSALKEFSIQLKIWAQEKNAKYWIEFPDSIFDKIQLRKSEKTSFRSISRLGEITSKFPSKIFPAYVWGESFHFPFVSNEPTVVSKIAKIEDTIEQICKRKNQKIRNTSIFKLEFQILSDDILDLEKILESPIPENFTEKILEKQEGLFLITPKLNGVQSLFAIYLFSNVSEKIKFNFSKLIIDLSESREILPTLLYRSGAIISAIDFENSPSFIKDENGNFSSLEISVPPWLSPSFLFLVLDSIFLDVRENLDLDLKIPTSFPSFQRNESWRELTEHRFASRISRHVGEEESFFHSILQNEYDMAKNVLLSILENKKKELEELEIPELLNRLKLVQELLTIPLDENVQKDWKLIQTEISNSLLEKWKEKKELENQKIVEVFSVSAWKILFEIWKSQVGRKP